jgi:XTP/dITP diphosphohydrolase
MLASLNKNKFKEFSYLFRAYPEIDFRPMTDFVWNPRSFDEVEVHQTFYDNAHAKCKLAHYSAKVPTIGEDSGLEVDFLGGRPGVHSKRYATPNPNETQDEANIRKILEELKNVPIEKRKARFVCSIVFMVEGIELESMGTLEGVIAEKPSGSNGFGYDPIFIPNGYDKTLAELPIEEKNRISHRAKALHKLMDLIKEKKIELVRP